MSECDAEEETDGRLLIDGGPRLLPVLREILRRHGVRRAAFFGSGARGQESESSDVDLLVEFAPGRSLLDQAALELDLIALFGREVEVVTYRKGPESPLLSSG
jgi:predicted nucleotidyltransferase